MKDEWEVGDTLICVACLVMGTFWIVYVILPVASWVIGR
jgi:succinate-acetate transporter protein